MVRICQVKINKVLFKSRKIKDTHRFVFLKLHILEFLYSRSGDGDEIPMQITKQITPFQQVLLMQALKPERLVSAMEAFVIKTLNLRELSPPALSLKHLYHETMASEPILIIISSGSDASDELRDLATRYRT